MHNSLQFVPSLLLFLFRRQRGIQLQHTFRQLHANDLVSEIRVGQIRFRVRDLVRFRPCLNYQQRRFTSPKLDVVNLSNLAVAIEHYASYEITDVSPSGLQICSFPFRNLQFTADQPFRIRYRVNTDELKNQISLVRPKFFNFYFLPRSVARQDPEPHSLVKSVRNVSMQFGCNFAAPPLGFQDARQRNELVCYSRISSA